MISSLLFSVFLGLDFPICTAESYQDYPVVRYINGLYYVFWTDERFFSSAQKFSVYVARVTTDGHVLDPDGKIIFCDSVTSRFDVAFGISNFLAVCRNGC
jgi:hypothetical protein